MNHVARVARVARHGLVAKWRGAKRVGVRALSALGAAALCASQSLAAETVFPQQTVTIVVPFAAGGSLDLTARILADKMKEILGQPVVVANRPGAGSAVGARAVATAAPDGHTLFLASGSAFGFLHLLVQNFEFRLDSFAPIGGVAINTSVFVVHPSVPAQTLPELVTLARNKPGGLSFCSTGVSGLNHLQLEMFKTLVKSASPSAPFEVTHIPYNGVAPALAALRGASVDACTLPYSALIKNMDGKDVRVIAVQRGKRLAALPNAATTGEQGFPAMDGNDQLVTLSAPKGTPPDVLQVLESALRKSMEDPATIGRLTQADVQPSFVGAKDAQAWLQEDVRKFSKIIRDAGLAIQ